MIWLSYIIVLIYTANGMCRYVYITYVGYDMCINSSTLAVIGVGSGFHKKYGWFWLLITFHEISYVRWLKSSFSYGFHSKSVIFLWSNNRFHQRLNLFSVPTCNVVFDECQWDAHVDHFVSLVRLQRRLQAPDVVDVRDGYIYIYTYVYISG